MTSVPTRPEPQSAPSGQDYASRAAVRLLREVADYERRLRRLNTHESSGRQSYLIAAYRRAMSLRQNLIDELPKPPERAPDPWRRN